MADLGSLTPFTTAASALSGLVLVSPQNTIGYQPQNPPAPNGQTSLQPKPLLFHYEGEQTVSIDSDITDHYVEDNTAIQDHIALRPEVITTHGFIGELNDIAPPGLATVQAAADKLTAIGSYAPGLSETALIAYNEAAFLETTALNLYNSSVAAWSSAGNYLNGTSTGGENVINSSGLGNAFNAQTGKISNNQNNQQVAFQQFYGYWRNRTLFTVQTPWAVFQNMAIKSLRAIQDADTNVISDFEVSFKMIRFASTKTVSVSAQGRLSLQAGGAADKGDVTPTISSGTFSQSLATV